MSRQLIPTFKDNHYSDVYHHLLVLPALELHMNDLYSMYSFVTGIFHSVCENQWGGGICLFSCLFLLSSISLYAHIINYLSILLLMGFRVLPIWGYYEKATINVLILHVFQWTCALISLGYISRSGISGS